MSNTNLESAMLVGANLSVVNLSNSNLRGANLGRAILTAADLSDANLNEADLTDARIENCSVFGVSVWNARLGNALQRNLLLGRNSNDKEPPIEVDNIQTAVLLNILLTSGGVRDLIDVVTSKVVLLLGRFTAESKAVLEGIQEALSRRGYVPILLDFEKLSSRDLAETVSTLAHMSRFVIADLTDPSTVPHELATFVPNIRVPVQPIILKGQHEYAMFVDLETRYPWVLKPVSYANDQKLIAGLDKQVIAPLEAKVRELNVKSRRINS